MFGGMSCPLHRFYRMHIELSCSHSADGFSSNATRQQPESRSMSRTISVGWPDSLELEARTRGARKTHDLHLPGRHWHDPRSFPECPRPSKMPLTTSLHRNLMKSGFVDPLRQTWSEASERLRDGHLPALAPPQDSCAHGRVP